MVMFPPRVTLRTLPPVRGQYGRTIPRCLGGCGTAMDDNRLICSVCWKHLPSWLQRNFIRSRRSTDMGLRQSVLLDVEQTCIDARRRIR